MNHNKTLYYRVKLKLSQENKRWNWIRNKNIINGSYKPYIYIKCLYRGTYGDLSCASFTITLSENLSDLLKHVPEKNKEKMNMIII